MVELEALVVAFAHQRVQDLQGFVDARREARFPQRVSRFDSRLHVTRVLGIEGDCSYPVPHSDGVRAKPRHEIHGFANVVKPVVFQAVLLALPFRPAAEPIARGRDRDSGDQANDGCDDDG